MQYDFGNFERMFNPGSVAVIGVSTEGFGFGRGILLALKAIGYEGNLYPVNRNGGTVGGLKIYRDIKDIPENIDFAVIAVPARFVPEALEACRLKGAAGAEILSSGFNEIGTAEGDMLNEQIIEIARKGIRVIGPNCFGIYCPKSGLTMLPGAELSRKSGPVALLSQSGGLSIDFAYMGKWRGIWFSKMISFGNGCDLRETEMLEYLRQDPETKIICLYMEGVKDGREFMQILSKTALEKPVIIMKGGLSDSGGRAVASHTASMGGSSKIWESVFRQCNVVRVKTLQEMADVALAFSMLPLEEYQNLTTIGGGGALGINAADISELSGLKMPGLKNEIKEEIQKILPQPGSSAANPVDIANPFVGPDILKQTIISASKDEQIQIHVMIQLLHSYKSLAHVMGKKDVKDVVPLKDLVDACTDAMKIGGKPVVMVLPNYKQERDTMDIEAVIREAREMFLSSGIPVFERMPDALGAISSVGQYVSRKKAILAHKIKENHS